MRPATGDSVVDALLVAGHAVRTAIDGALRQDGLSLSRKKTLAVLARADAPVTLRRLSDELGLAARSVTDLVDGLEDEGLARRDRDPRDRRCANVVITSAGRAALAAAERKTAAVARRFTSALEPAERKELVELLRRLRAVDAPVGAAR
jgi:DNA-binding MarR family transcriptional regulator